MDPDIDPLAALTGQPPDPSLQPNLAIQRLQGMTANDPALGLAMIRTPELVAGHLAANGVAPPSDQPDGVGADDASQSLGKALSGGSGFSGIVGQQGAEDGVPLPRPRPTPAAETANDTGAAVPAAATPVGDSGVSGQSVAPSTSTKASGATNPVDDLGKALAGLKPIPPPAPPVIRSPEPYRPTNQISRSSLPSVLLQQLANITKGTTGPYRLGQALRGIKAE